MAVSLADLATISIVFLLALFTTIVVIEFAIGLSAGGATAVQAASQYNRHVKRQKGLICERIVGDKLEKGDIAQLQADGRLVPPVLRLLADGHIGTKFLKANGLEACAELTADNVTALQAANAVANADFTATRLEAKNVLQTTQAAEGNLLPGLTAKCAKELDELPACPEDHGFECITDHHNIHGNGKGAAVCRVAA